MQDIRTELGLRPVINVSGTMTSLGASIVVNEAVDAVTRSLTQFFEMGELQKRASAVIADLTGAEAGFVTASCSSGITLAVAGAMTGPDLLAIERLPDTSRLRNEVIMLSGHMISYGAPVEQAVRLAGATVVPVGQATSSHAYQLAGSINENTAAAVFVVSHHVVDYAQLPLRTFIRICHEKAIPVIVDAASEYDLRIFLDLGADLVVYSGHKFLGGPTSGIVAGSKDLVRSAYLQNRGIGRGMKVGKESIVGAMAALSAWKIRDHDAIRRRERAALDLWFAALGGKPGVQAELVPDPTGNPLDRLKVGIDPEQANIAAWDLALRLASGTVPVIVRDHEIEHGHFFLDPYNLHPGQEETVASRLLEELESAGLSNALIATPSTNSCSRAKLPSCTGLTERLIALVSLRRQSMSIDGEVAEDAALGPKLRRRTSGMDRALQILDFLQETSRSATAYEIARGIGAPLSTIYVIVDDLVEKDMLSRSPDGNIWLGHRLYHYGLSYARHLDLLSVATDEMRHLAEASGEVVQVCGRDGNDMVVLAMEEGAVQFQVAARIGTRSPLNWTASGRLLVGHLSPEERLATFKTGAKPSPTGRAETDPQVLADGAGEAFRQRLSIQAGESNFSVACIAAPIIDRSGACQATMSIVVPENKVTQKDPDLIQLVKESALRVEARLGWL